MANEYAGSGDVAGRGNELAGLTGPLARIAAALRVPVTVRVGETEMALSEIASLGPGAVVELNRRVGDMVDVLVAGTLVARGELVSVEGRLGVRITEILAQGD
ncbi:MAG: FliM/FliN family flagellar motor switch protein [Armatimonadetes bacterium]|nr:FliM/FliN family flagellar motor switch protein [Armatimonadota bacterium]